MKKRTLSLLLAVACALSLSGCGGAPAPDAQTSAPAGSETPAAVDQTREIVFAASRDQCPGEQDAYYASMSLGVWEPLITKDESGKPAPALATEWEHNEDSTVWTFHLREGVTFSNGTPFNADSVLANFDRMKKGPFESSFYGMNIDTIYPGLVSYEKTDDYTVVLTLSEGQPLLDYTMVNYGSAIFEPSCFAEDGTFAGFPIGTGPYVVTENVLGQYCVIERNDNYWG
ncbi:MAG: ABC transporter substrate-binding protein, partial [Flavonifractor plautii]